MKPRLIGQTDGVVGEAGPGCWSIGGNWGEVRNETAPATPCAAYEAGANFFDTADVPGVCVALRTAGGGAHSRPF